MSWENLTPLPLMLQSTRHLANGKAGADIYTPPVQSQNIKDTLIVDRKDAPQTTLLIGLPTLLPNDKDYVAMYVTNTLLGGFFGSRITSNIRESKGYTYSPVSSILNRRGVSVWTEAADVTSEHTVDALQEIEKEIRRLQDEPPSAEELKGIQNYLTGIFCTSEFNTQWDYRPIAVFR
jgi:predicted Zn-dependent peptidase